MNLTAILGAAGAAYLFFRKKDETTGPCADVIPSATQPIGPWYNCCNALRRAGQSSAACDWRPEYAGLSGAGGLGAWPIMFPEAPGPTVLAMGSLGESPCGSAAWLREVYRGTCPHRRAAWDRLSRAGCAPSTARPRCVGQGMA